MYYLKKREVSFLTAFLVPILAVLLLLGTGCAELHPIVDRLTEFFKAYNSRPTVTVFQDVDIATNSVPGISVDLSASNQPLQLPLLQ